MYVCDALEKLINWIEIPLENVTARSAGSDVSFEGVLPFLAPRGATIPDSKGCYHSWLQGVLPFLAPRGATIPDSKTWLKNLSTEK